MSAHSGLSRGGAFSPLRLAVTAPGSRAALSFGLPGGWGKTTRTDITLPPDGQTPDLNGVSSFIQGNGHRDMLPLPVVFHLNGALPCRFRLVFSVSAAGAHPTLALDGNPAAETDFPATGKDQDTDQEISLEVPAGTHIVSVFNTGPDWVNVKRISVTDYVPAVAVLAKGDAHAVFFWAYTRDRQSAARAATLTVTGLAPGRYRVRLWEPWQGRALPPIPAVRQAGQWQVTLPAMTKDIAGVVEPER